MEKQKELQQAIALVRQYSKTIPAHDGYCVFNHYLDNIIEAIVPKNTSMHDAAVIAGINECYRYISQHLEKETLCISVL